MDNLPPFDLYSHAILQLAWIMVTLLESIEVGDKPRRNLGSCPIYWASLPDESGNYILGNLSTRP